MSNILSQFYYLKWEFKLLINSKTRIQFYCFTVLGSGETTLSSIEELKQVYLAFLMKDLSEKQPVREYYK